MASKVKKRYLVLRCLKMPHFIENVLLFWGKIENKFKLENRAF